MSPQRRSGPAPAKTLIRVDASTADLARRIAFVISGLEGRLCPQGDAVQRGLELLEVHLRKMRVRVPPPAKKGRRT